MSYTSTDLDMATLPPEAPQALVPYGPTPQRWYKTPPRPKTADVVEAAESERAMHDDRVQQGLKMLRRLNDPNMAGVFPRLLKDVASGKVSRVQLPGLRDETDMIVSTFAQMDWVIEALYRSNLDRERAAAKEDLGAYLQENAQRQYSRALGGSIKAAKIFDLAVFGCVAEFNGLDVDNDECGLRMRLVDPNTIFPVAEGERGLSCVYLKYQAEATDFIGNFGSLDGFDEDAVRDLATENGTYDPHCLGEVTEMWDRNWYWIGWEGEEIACDEHNYAEVPFIVTPGNFGQPAHITASTTITRHSSLDGGSWRTDRSEDLMRIYQPFLQRRVEIHQLEEATAGIVVTKVRRSLNPARTTRNSVLTIEDEAVKFDDDEGTTTKTRIEDEWDVNDASISMDPQVAAAAFAIIQQGKATSTPSSIIAGQAPMSQGSGTALNVLKRGGVERWALIGEIAMLHEAASTEQRFRFIRDFGNLIGMDGAIYVPRRRSNQRSGQAPAHEVTSDLLRKTGVRVTVQFRLFNPTELTSLSQGVGMLRSIGLIPKREAIEIIGYTDDPDRAIQDMDREMLDESPEITQVNMLDALIEDLEEAGFRGDDEELEALFYRLMLVSDLLEQSQNKRTAEGNQAQMAAMMSAMPGVNGLPQANPGTQGGRTGGAGDSANPLPGLAGPAGPPPIGG
jgi:hypothetical protein